MSDRNICEEGMNSNSIMWLGGGGRYDLLRPNKENISLGMIINSLSKQCRFNGHTNGHYSVAEHSVRVSLICRDYPLEALMHDAAEAFIGDITRPVRKAMGPEAERRLNIIEEQSLKVVFEKYNIIYPLPPIVKEMDDVVLADELNNFRKNKPIGKSLNAQRASEYFWERLWELGEKE